MKRNDSLHSFTMKEAFAHEDEGTATSTATTVVGVMANAKEHFPDIITAHQLFRSLNVILKPKGFTKENTLLATCFDCDEVCRDLEDELREAYGQNFNLGGIAGFPFGGYTAFGAMTHHVPHGGTILIVYGPHVGIDLDGVIGRVNRQGHHGSGTCCSTSIAGLAYVRAVKAGLQTKTLDPSDPANAQQVFVDEALMKHADRLLGADNPNLELPHVVFDCISDLMKRITDKCLPMDVKPNTKIALLGGIQVNTPEGTPEYFLPKKFSLMDYKGNEEQDLLAQLIEEGNRDIKDVIKQAKLDRMMEEAKASIIDVPIMEF